MGDDSIGRRRKLGCTEAHADQDIPRPSLSVTRTDGTTLSRMCLKYKNPLRAAI
jgi:hypothetical protein